MKISELINILQEKQSILGDVEVLKYDRDKGAEYFVEHVYETKDESGMYIVIDDGCRI